MEVDRFVDVFVADVPFEELAVGVMEVVIGFEVFESGGELLLGLFSTTTA